VPVISPHGRLITAYNHVMSWPTC